MLATKIVCPHCHKALRASKPLAAGKRVLCKQCGTMFAVSSQGVSANTPFPTMSPAGIQTVAPAAAPTMLDEAPITTEVVGSYLLKLAVVGVILAGGFAVIAGGSVLALWYVWSKDSNSAHNTKSEPTTAPARTTAPPRGKQREEEEEREPGDRVPVRDPVKEAPPPRLPPAEQAKVDAASAKGVEYLKKQQTGNGYWPVYTNHGHEVAMAALPGLTLLECGVSPKDPQVQKAAQYVREHVPKLTHTYDLSLAILFLDRLGDDADRKHIRSMALRLVAGQKADGGWTYDCQTLSSAEEDELLQVLEKTRPRNPLELFTGSDGKVLPEYFMARPGETLPEFVTPKEPGVSDPKKPGDRDGDRAPADINKELEKASARVKNIASLKDSVGNHGFLASPQGSDNSNTQFAILAVWVSGRHGVPLERTLAMLVKRFRTSQDAGGRWGYSYTRPGNSVSSSPSMTVAGLLGLGAGYGMTADVRGNKADQGGVQDPAIRDAFQSLARDVGQPLGTGPGGIGHNHAINMYFLWSIERVGVMYNLTKIGDKDWYKDWALELADKQAADGSWNVGGFHNTNPVLDTSLALLFLHRANLAKDLSKKLEYIDVKGFGSK
jgi:hypothetical protein